MSPERYGTVVEVLVAACTGAARLSAELGGLTLVHVAAVSDAAAALVALNARQHGCAVRWPRSFQALRIERGWDDWMAFRLELVRPDGLAALDRAAMAGVDVVGGRMLVRLPAGVPLGEFAAQLAGALRHLRLQEATIRPAFLEARCRAMAELVVHPRYTPPRVAWHDVGDAVLVEDLYALDPAEDAGRLFWLAAAARAAAVEGRSPWR